MSARLARDSHAGASGPWLSGSMYRAFSQFRKVRGYVCAIGHWLSRY